MNRIIYVWKVFYQVALLLVGLAMLFGGGACVVMDIGGIFRSNFDSLGLMLFFSILAALFAWGGYIQIKAVKRNWPKSIDEDKEDQR
jgi:hypothetical protein